MLSSKEDEEISHEADNIASKIAEVLIQAFKGKEGREPTAEELEALFDEVTEERVEEMLNGKFQEGGGELVHHSLSEDEDDDDEVASNSKPLRSGGEIKLEKTDIAGEDSSNIGIKRPLNDN